MQATHGKWCNTWTWPTKCRQCKAPVFYFQCDCLSKIFFDKLGPPWPHHNCDTSWADNLNRTVDDAGGMIVQITPSITVQRVPHDFSIDPTLVSEIDKHTKQPNRDPIEAIEPETSLAERTVTGILRYKSENIVNPFKPSVGSSVGLALLGPFGKGEWNKLTLHEKLTNQNRYHSYTFWVENSNIASAENSIGVTVRATIVPYRILNQCVWPCMDYTVL